MTHFEEAVDSLDASIFSSDNLAQEENRGLLKEHLARWERELDVWEKLSSERTESCVDEDQQWSELMEK